MPHDRAFSERAERTRALSTFALISQNRQASRDAVRNRIEFATDVQADVPSS